MTDYDLGKAKGRIVIEHDDRGFRRAEGANDNLAKSAHRVAEGFQDAEKAQNAFEKQSRKAAAAQDALDRKNQEVQRNLNKLNEAQTHANRLKAEGKEKTDRYKTALENVTKSQNRYNESVSESSRLESRRNAEVAKADKAVRDLENAIRSHNRNNRVDVDTSDVHRKLAKVRNDWHATSRLMRGGLGATGGLARGGTMALGGASLGGLAGLAGSAGSAGAGAGVQGIAGIVSAVADMSGALARGGTMALGGASLGGLAGLAGSAGAGAVVQGIAGIVSAVDDMSGALGTLPGVVGGIVAAVGTIKLGLQGFDEAMKNLGTDKFAEALQGLAPQAQQAAIAINSLKGAFDLLKMNVQNNLFMDMGQVIKDVATVYIPMMSKSLGDIALVLNGAVKQFAAFLMLPSTQGDIQGFLHNVASAFKILSDNMKPALQAFNDIMSVSGELLPELASGLGEAIQQFSKFIADARASGELKAWIQGGIDALKTFGKAIIDIGSAFHNIGRIADSFGGGIINWLAKIGAEFKAWTESVSGKNALSAFFQATTTAMNAFMPILKSVGETIFGVILPGLANLGVGIAPGLKLFFDEIGAGFKILSQALNDPKTVGALNQFLGALGGAILGVVQQLGPILPQLFQDLSDALTELAPLLPGIAQSMAEMLKNIVPLIPKIAEIITPQLINMMLEWTKFLEKNGPLLLAVLNVVLGVVRAISGLSDWLERLTGHRFITILPLWSAAIDVVRDAFNGLKNAVATVLEFLGGLAANIATIIPNIINTVGSIADKIFEKFGEIKDKALDWGKGIFQSFIDGMLSQLGPIGDAAKWLMDKVSEYIPHSPAKKGPFSGQGYALIRGRTLAEDFAAGIVAGSGSASSAGSTLSKATETGIHQFVSDMLQISGFGQRVLSLIGDTVNNVFSALKIFTTNPITGESVFGKSWKRTVSDADLRRQKEDKAFQDSMNPKNTQPSLGPSGAQLATLPLSVKKGDTKDSIAKNIVAEGQRRGYSNDQLQAILATSMRESGLNPDIWDPSGQWYGLFQQDKSYANRNDPNQQILEFYNRLDRLRASGGSSGDIWKDIFWLQQAPGAKSANSAYAGGRQAYLSEIMSQQGPAGDLLKQILGNIPAGLPAGAKNNPNIFNPKGSQPAAIATAAMIEQLFPQIQTIGGQRQDSMPYHTQGRALDVMIPNYNTPEGKALGDQIKSWALANAKSIGLEDVIWQDFWQPAGGGQGHSLGRGPDPTQGHYNHVHLTFANGASVDIPADSPLAKGFFGSQGGLGNSVGGGVAPGGNFYQQWYPGAPVTQTPLANSAGADLPFSPADNSALNDIANNTADQVNQQDQMIAALRGQDPKLDEQIRIAQDAASTDEQVGSALDYISKAAQDQRNIDTPQSRYTAQGLDSLASDIAGGRGMTQTANNPLDVASGIASGAVGLVGDGFKIVDGVLKSIDSAATITDTLVRGIENTADVNKIVDEVQTFVELAATISQTVTDGLSLASSIASAAGSDPSGGGAAAAGGLQAAAAISGIVTSVISSINAAIDLTQEGLQIAGKYTGKLLSYMVGGGQGSLLGDIKFLLDQNTGELKTWSGDNPQDKRSFALPYMPWDGPLGQGQGKIRDLNMYVGPGTDPNEAMNAAMWSIKTDTNGVFTSSAY